MAGGASRCRWRPCPVAEGDGWAVRDTEGRCCRSHPRFTGGWQLLALSGGHPLILFGEWDGDILRPPEQVCADGRSAAIRRLSG